MFNRPQQRRFFSRCLAERRTRAWVQNWVLKQKLCPFAAPLVEKDTLKIRVTRASGMEELRAAFLEEVSELMEGIRSGEEDEDEAAAIASASDQNRKSEDSSSRVRVESTLLVVDDDGAMEITSSSSDATTSPAPSTSSSPASQQELPFLHDYHDFYRASWDLQQLLVEQQAQEHIQLVLFHPQAVHSLYGDGGGNSFSSYSEEDEGEPPQVSPSELAVRSPSRR